MNAPRSLPKINVTDRQLRDISSDALQALRRANQPPHVFTMGSEIVRVVLRDDGRHVVQELDEAAMRGSLARSADYSKISKKGDSYAVSPPMDVVKDLLSIPSDQLHLRRSLPS
jgi:hypothetical protein